mgnify:CR=1 FL=1
MRATWKQKQDVVKEYRAMVPNQMTKEEYLAAKGIGSARNKIELEGLLIVEQSEDPRGGEARPLAHPRQRSEGRRTPTQACLERLCHGR